MCRGCRGRWRYLSVALVAAPLILVFLNMRLHRLLPSESASSPEPAAFHPSFRLLLEQLEHKFSPPKTRNVTRSWNIAKKWSEEDSLFSLNRIGEVLVALRTAKIVSAENSRKGTQLKLTLTLEGNVSVFFKPKWYSREEIVRGFVYSGKDRHNAEVVAFYLAAILDIRWAPLAVIRKVNMKSDIWDNATPELRQTMLTLDSGSLCMYGKCFYCKRNETVCGDHQNQMEGAIILLIDYKFQKYRSPWQRTYDSRRQAEWEVNPDYCWKVKNALSTTRLLDLIDASVFDFLIQNGDRHHYETMKDKIVLLDNGKGLGNPHKDFNDILAPLYQCCMLRQSTWKRLKLLSGGYLSTILSSLLDQEAENPVLTKLHLQAIDRRLLTIYSIVESCLAKHGKSILKPM